MTKKLLCILAAAFAVTLCGLGIWYYFFGTKEYDLTPEGTIQETEYRENAALKEKLSVASYEIPLEKDESVQAYCVYEKWIYYALDYQLVFENPEGNRTVPEFSDKYQTQIRRRNIETGEDEMLYKYDSTAWVSVITMQCNGKDLIWEDSRHENECGWSICHMKLDGSQEVEIILAEDMQMGRLSCISPTIYEDSIFWYDLLEGEGFNGVAYEYEFDTKKYRVAFEDVRFASPYEQIPLVGDAMTTYRYEGKEASRIYISEKSGKKKEIKVPGNIRDAISNRKICVWLKGYEAYDNREQLMLCEFASGEAEQINIPSIFSHALTENFLIINTPDGVYAYDTAEKEYVELISADESCSPCGYTFQGADGGIYATASKLNTIQSDGMHIYIIRERE